MVRYFAVPFAALILLVLSQPVAKADSFVCTPGTNGESCSVTINTSSLAGAGQFGFFPVLLDASQSGDGNNTASLSGFGFGGGSPGSASSFGGGSGNFSSGMTITDSDPSGFNSVLGLFTPGGTLSFNLVMSTFLDSSPNPASGIPGDQFVLMILDSSDNNVITNDSTPAEDAFLTITVCPPAAASLSVCQGGLSQNGVNIKQFEIPSTASSVPEPATLLLLGSGMIGLGWRKRRLSKQVSPSK